jgi:hypothetical protein
VDVHVTRTAVKWPEEPMVVVATAQLDPERLDRRNVCFFISHLDHADLDVDYRFGRQSGHRCRTDVIDSPGRWIECAQQPLLPSSETFRPRGVIRGELDRLDLAIGARD